MEMSEIWLHTTHYRDDILAEAKIEKTSLMVTLGNLTLVAQKGVAVNIYTHI